MNGPMSLPRMSGGLGVWLLLLLLTWPSVGQAGGAGELPCFVYHRFGDDLYPSTNIALDVFAAQLSFLRDQNFRVLTLGEALEQLDSDRGLSERTVVLTVDDGYQSFLTGALPLLRRFGFAATLFINTDSVGRPGYMTWDDLAGLAAEGIEIGNHSASHAYFLNLPTSEQLSAFKKDVERAQEAFQTHLGWRPSLFAYPFGEYLPAWESALRELGFKAAAAQNSGVVYRGSPRYALPRYPMGGPYATLEGFRQKSRMRALHITDHRLRSLLLDNSNPPILEVEVDTGGLNVAAMQFFVQGQQQALQRPDPDDLGRLLLQADKPLTGRRTLYTLTAPSTDGRVWHWFSHVWVRPEVEE